MQLMEGEPRYSGRFVVLAAVGFLTSLVLMLWDIAPAMAQGSLGIGRPEPVIAPSGPFASILFWIQQQQKEFYQALTEALKLIRSGEGGAWVLITLSFGYGVLHAAGPGHGKAVISSYMLANEVQLRRGVLLSFVSSIMQAVVAILVIGLLVFVLNGFGFKQSGLTRWLEIASYAGVTLLGLWLLWRKIFAKQNTKHTHHHRHGHAHANAHAHDHDHDHDHNHDHAHHHGDEAVCSECGHSHAPDPKLLEGEMGLREAAIAVMAVGLRPCTGALIVLTFAFLNGLYLAGIASAFAMAVGTAITVSTFASLAVGGKNLVLRFTGVSETSLSARWWIEVAGALFILLMGIALLSASLY